MKKFPKILAIALLSLGCVLPMAACEKSISTDDNEPTRQRGVEETPNLTDEMPKLPDFPDFTEQEDGKMPAPPVPHGRDHGRKCPPPPPKGDPEEDGGQKDEEKEEDGDSAQDEKTVQRDEIPEDGKRPVKPVPKPVPKPKHTHASKEL